MREAVHAFRRELSLGKSNRNVAKNELAALQAGSHVYPKNAGPFAPSGLAKDLDKAKSPFQPLITLIKGVRAAAGTILEMFKSSKGQK